MFGSLSVSTRIGLVALCAATFTAITSEMAPVALMLEMARTFHTSTGHIGLAVTAYALIVAVAAVPLPVLTAREIGRASRGERGESAVVRVSLKQTQPTSIV